MKTVDINTIDELILVLNEMRSEIGGNSLVRLGTSYEDVDGEEKEYQAYISVVEQVDHEGQLIVSIY